jgi:hypothetical protein
MQYGTRALLIYRLGDRGSKYLWNVGKLLQDYTARLPRKQSYTRRRGDLKSHLRKLVATFILYQYYVTHCVFSEVYLHVRRFGETTLFSSYLLSLYFMYFYVYCLRYIYVTEVVCTSVLRYLFPEVYLITHDVSKCVSSPILRCPFCLYEVYLYTVRFESQLYSRVNLRVLLKCIFYTLRFGICLCCHI